MFERAQHRDRSATTAHLRDNNNDRKHIRARNTSRVCVHIYTYTCARASFLFVSFFFFLPSGYPDRCQAVAANE